MATGSRKNLRLIGDVVCRCGQGCEAGPRSEDVAGRAEGCRHPLDSTCRHMATVQDYARGQIGKSNAVLHVVHASVKGAVIVLYCPDLQVHGLRPLSFVAVGSARQDVRRSSSAVLGRLSG